MQNPSICLLQIITVAHMIDWYVIFLNRTNYPNNVQNARFRILELFWSAGISTLNLTETYVSKHIGPAT